MTSPPFPSRMTSGDSAISSSDTFDAAGLGLPLDSPPPSDLPRRVHFPDAGAGAHHNGASASDGGADDDLDDLVRTWATLKLETEELRELCDTSREGLRRLESSNAAIEEALQLAGAPTRRAPSGPCVVVVEPLVDDDEDEEADDDDDEQGAEQVAEEGADAADDFESRFGGGFGDDEEDGAFEEEEEVTYRSLAAFGDEIANELVDDADDAAALLTNDFDEPEPTYRSLSGPIGDAEPPPAPAPAPAAPAGSLHQMSLQAMRKRQRSYTSELAPQMLQPRKQSSGPEARSSPTEEARKLHELRESIDAERRARETLLQVYRENEAMLARLQDANRELMRQVALLRESAPAPTAAASVVTSVLTEAK